jgi:hypothetical protein
MYLYNSLYLFLSLSLSLSLFLSIHIHVQWCIAHTRVARIPPRATGKKTSAQRCNNLIRKEEEEEEEEEEGVCHLLCHVGHCGPSGLERLKRRVVLCELQCSSARLHMYTHIYLCI